MTEKNAVTTKDEATKNGLYAVADQRNFRSVVGPLERDKAQIVVDEVFGGKGAVLEIPVGEVALIEANNKAQKATLPTLNEKEGWYFRPSDARAYVTRRTVADVANRVFGVLPKPEKKAKAAKSVATTPTPKPAAKPVVTTPGGNVVPPSKHGHPPENPAAKAPAAKKSASK